jgi:hypothetical protein
MKITQFWLIYRRLEARFFVKIAADLLFFLLWGSAHRDLWKSELSVPKKLVLCGLFWCVLGKVYLKKCLAGTIYTGLTSIKT